MVKPLVPSGMRGPGGCFVAPTACSAWVGEWAEVGVTGLLEVPGRWLWLLQLLLLWWWWCGIWDPRPRPFPPRPRPPFPLLPPPPKSFSLELSSICYTLMKRIKNRSPEHNENFNKSAESHSNAGVVLRFQFPSASSHQQPPPPPLFSEDPWLTAHCNCSAVVSTCVKLVLTF